MVRTTLDTLAELTTHLWDEAQHGRASTSELPGGDALVLLSPGHYQPNPWAWDGTGEERPNDPRPPLVVLAHWARWWARRMNHSIVVLLGPTPTLGNVHSYLDGQLHLIAQEPAFPRMARDLSRVLHQVEDVLHDGERPEVSRVPCWECGARLEKQYGSREQEDRWTCPRCREVYDRGRYERAKHDHLHSKGADRFVVVADAAGAVGRPERTVRTWMDRGLVESRRDPKTGRVWVWWPDVREQHLRAGARSRRAAG